MDPGTRSHAFSPRTGASAGARAVADVGFEAQRTLRGLVRLFRLARHGFAAAGALYLACEAYEIGGRGEGPSLAVLIEVGLVALITPAVAWAACSWGEARVRGVMARHAQLVGASTAGLELMGALGLEGVLDRVVGSILDVFAVRQARVFTLDRASRSLVCVAAAGADRDSWIGRRLAIGESVAGKAVEVERAIRSADALADPAISLPAWLQTTMHRTGMTAVAAVPLTGRGGVLGALTLADAAGRDFTDGELRVLSGFATAAALVMENATLHEETQGRQRAAEALIKVGRLVTQSLDAEVVAERVVESVRVLLGAPNSCLHLLDAATGALTTAASSGQPPPPAAQRGTLPAGTGAAGLAVRERRPVAVSDVLADPRVILTPDLREAVERGPYRSVLAAPLVAGDTIIGVLSTRDGPHRTFTESDVRTIETFAATAALAIQNARLYAETARRQREAEVLAEVARSLNSVLSLDTVLQLVTDRARELCGSDVSAIATREPAGTMLFRFWSGATALTLPRIAPGKGLGGRVLVTRRPFRTHDSLADARAGDNDRTFAGVGSVAAELAVPVIIGEQVEALLYVQNRSSRPFTDREETTLVRLAAHAATAITNARLYEDARRQLRTTETLLEVSRSVGATLDLAETMRRVARHLARALRAEMVGAYVPDRDASVLRPLAGYHVPPGLVEPFRAFPFPLRGHPFLEDAVRRGAPAFVSNPVLDPRIDRAILERFPAASVLFVPMLANGELLGGLFAVWWTLREAPPADEMRLAEAIARQATLAVANARLFGVSEERRRVAKTLGEVVHLLSSSLEPTVVAERIVDSVRGLLRAPSAALFRLDPESKALVAVAVSGALTAAFGPAFRFPPGTGAVGVAARTRRPLVTPDVLDDPHIVLTPQMRERLAQAGLGATLAVPLLVKGEVIGALGLADHKGRLFEPEEILLVQTLADEGAVALENARLFESSRVAVEAQKALARRVVEVQENERHHVARELHDEIGQLLTGITFALDAIPRGSGRRAGSLAQARELAQEAIARVREMALDLRPPMLDDLGLFPTLMWHVERFTRQTGIRVEVKQSGLEHRRFAAEVESAVYRIVQEALTNVARHAGVAEATVRLLADTLAIRVDVEDRGVGFETAALLDAPTSIGLAGMRERARLLGGEFRVDSTPGVATILSVELPLTGPRGGPPEAP